MSKFDKIINEYYEKMEGLRSEYQTKKSQVYNTEEQKKKALDEIKTAAKMVQTDYQDQLNRTYKNQQQEVKARVGFGEGDPTKTRAELSMADDLNKTEIEILANRYKDQGNYLGLKKLSETAFEKNVAVDFQDVESQLDQLNKQYESKQDKFSDKPLNDSEENILRAAAGLDTEGVE